MFQEMMRRCIDFISYYTEQIRWDVQDAWLERIVYPLQGLHARHKSVRILAQVGVVLMLFVGVASFAIGAFFGAGAAVTIPLLLIGEPVAGPLWLIPAVFLAAGALIALTILLFTQAVKYMNMTTKKVLGALVSLVGGTFFAWLGLGLAGALTFFHMDLNNAFDMVTFHPVGWLMALCGAGLLYASYKIFTATPEQVEKYGRLG
jgi:hypothetical protein